jgi:hypothetical protein
MSEKINKAAKIVNLFFKMAKNKSILLTKRKIVENKIICNNYDLKMYKNIFKFSKHLKL